MVKGRTTKTTTKKTAAAAKPAKKKAGLQLEYILYSKKNKVAYVTINRPEVRNALNSEVREELAIAIEDA